MTREEANFIGAMNMCDEISNEAYKKIMCHCEEQEPVLDKIIAEIDKEIIPRNSDQYDYEARWQNMGLRMALKVIDKYRAERSDKE